MLTATQRSRVSSAGGRAASLLGLDADDIIAPTSNHPDATERSTGQNLFALVADTNIEHEKQQAIFAGLNSLRDATEKLLQGVSFFDERIGILKRVVDVLARGFSAIKRACPEAIRIQDEITELLSVSVVELADADYAFVRQHNSDGTFVLVGRQAQGERGFPGRPPMEKRLDESLLAWNIDAAQPEPKVIICANAATAGEGYRTALNKIRARLSPSAVEKSFVDAIGAEVVVPLYLKPPIQFLGLIVGVRRAPYTEDMEGEVRERLEWVQPILESLFAVGSILSEFHYSRRQQALMSQWQRRVQKTFDDNVFFRQVVTYLTCGEGIGWHRAMLFLFQGAFPHDAVCVGALGDSGERARSEVHERIACETDSLEGYMLRCEALEYDHLVCEDDALYRRSRDKENPWVIPHATWNQDPTIRALFGEGSQVPDGIDRGYVEYEARHACHVAPSLLAAEVMRPAFRGPAERCVHYLFPLFRPCIRPARRSSPVALGFLIVDSPFIAPTRMETKSKLLLTQTACSFVEWLTADRRSGDETVAGASAALPLDEEDLIGTCAPRKDRVSVLPNTSRRGESRNREERIVTKTRRIECIVDGFRGDKARCLARVAGTLVPMEMPRTVLEQHGLRRNMRFYWTGAKDDFGQIRPEDIIPIEYPYEPIPSLPNGQPNGR